jgi:hypothetical protein
MIQKMRIKARKKLKFICSNNKDKISSNKQRYGSKVEGWPEKQKPLLVINNKKYIH